jgi:hypothetical protein
MMHDFGVQLWGTSFMTAWGVVSRLHLLVQQAQGRLDTIWLGGLSFLVDDSQL